MLKKTGKQMRFILLFGMLIPTGILLVACSDENTGIVAGTETSTVSDTGTDTSTPTTTDTETDTDPNNLGKSFSVSDEVQCSSTHEKVGTSADFTTFAHGVRVTLTVVDDCTLELTSFDYDGGGPEVYFYGGLNGVYSGANSFALSLRLNGNTFTDNTLTLVLPADKTLDVFDSISVWCVDFRANFGDVTI